MTPYWRVRLPPGTHHRVFVNGVPQVEGRDYVRRGRDLLFEHELRKEGKLGFWRWAAMFLALFGTYRKNDSVDVQYELDGRTCVATALDIVPPEVGSADADRPDTR